MRAILDVILPVFAIILTGYLAGRIKLLGPDSSEALNKFCYWFALPPVLFLGPARVPLDQVFNLPFIATFMGGVGITWAIALVVGLAERDFLECGLYGHSAVPGGVRAAGRAAGRDRDRELHGAAGGCDGRDRRGGSIGPRQCRDGGG
jgi:hypothetical protein